MLHALGTKNNNKKIVRIIFSSPPTHTHTKKEDKFSLKYNLDSCCFISSFLIYSENIFKNILNIIHLRHSNIFK